MTLKQRTIAFIGGGHITGIILENLTRSGKTDPRRLVVNDPDLQKLESLQKKNLRFKRPKAINRHWRLPISYFSMFCRRL